MGSLKNYIRRRRSLRAGGWTLVIGLLLAGLYAANHLLPVKTSRPATGLPARAPDPVHEGLVGDVVDGDTILLEAGILVRLKGIDTPEVDRTGFDEAKQALKGLVSGKWVELEYDSGDRVDRYRRLLAYLKTSACPCVNEELLRQGHGWIYRLDPGSGRWEGFLEAQRSAMSRGAGIWAGFQDRRDPFIGTRSSRVFHRARCEFARRVPLDGRQSFEGLREAFRQGYSPCRTCFRQPLEGR